MKKPFSQACERNQPYICDVVGKLVPEGAEILEIGSGTGQHAVFLGQNLPDVKIQTSDLKQNHNGINQWIDEAFLTNVFEPIELDVNHFDMSLLGKKYDAVFTANTTHVMSWDTVKNMLKVVNQVLKPNGLFMIYGPLNLEGKFTSDSNEAFDKILKEQDPQQGIRDLEAIIEELEKFNIAPHQIAPMPKNNIIVSFIKK